MPNLKQATITFLSHLVLTLLLSATFALLDYLSNHNTINYQQLIIFVSGPVIIALLKALQSYYQAQGDTASSDILGQLIPRIEQLEQRLLQLPLASPQPVRAPLPPTNQPAQPMRAPRPLAPDTTSPMAPRFSMQASLDRPVSPDIPAALPRQLPAGGAEPTFSLTSPELEAQAARLASFPFQEKPAADKHA